MREWLRRSAELQRELAAITEVDVRWWLISGGVAIAERWATPELYLASDAEADADTFMAHRATWGGDPIAHAIARARAARTALGELDGTLPDQPLAVTIDRARGGALRPCTLDVAAFAIADRCVVGRIDDPSLAAKLETVLSGGAVPAWSGPRPFVCVAVGDEPLATARHGHRRAWGDHGGPWLGLGRAGDLAIVSTCHIAVDGYGHARIAARIAQLTEASTGPGRALPALAPVRDAIPLGITWRQLAGPSPRVIPLAYATGCLLHRAVGLREARFSPTIQIPVARGARGDPKRLHRRVVSATTSVRFSHGTPEPLAAFEARTRAVIAREAAAAGLISRLLAAARAVPAPLAWKRRSIGAKRPAFLESFAEVIGGRALVSRIALDVPAPPLCAVSSPARLASERDPLGSCVITMVDDGTQSAITLSGSGFAGTPERAAGILDQLVPVS